MRREVHVRFCERLGVRFPRATRLVICCRGNAEAALKVMGQMMERLKLQVNEDKTGISRSPDEQVTFLGYTIGRCYSTRTGRAYIGTRPSKQSIRRLTHRISALTARRHALVDADTQVRRLNRLVLGWGN